MRTGKLVVAATCTALAWLALSNAFDRSATMVAAWQPDPRAASSYNSWSVMAAIGPLPAEAQTEALWLASSHFWTSIALTLPQIWKDHA